MKKILLSSVLLANVLFANDTKYEIKPMIGYVDTKDKVDIKSHKVFGIGLSRSLKEKYIMDELEFSLLQSQDTDYENLSGDTKVTLFSINGIENYKLNQDFKLYAIGGLGYERISDSKYGNNSDPFFNYGIGAAYSLSKNISIHLDARHELKFDGDKNIIYTLGLSIPFGQKNSLALNQEISKKEKNTKIGNLDSNINSPKDLVVLFDFNSDKIQSKDDKKLEKYAQYMKAIPNSKVVLEGHTDSTGTQNYNMKLSQKRANSAKKLLLSKGIYEYQIKTIAYGETKPIVSNDTKLNRAQNRRVKVKITK